MSRRSWILGLALLVATSGVVAGLPEMAIHDDGPPVDREGGFGTAQLATDAEARNDSGGLSVTPTSLNFVDADGDPATATVTVENPTDADGPVRIEATTIVGRDADAYTVIEGAAPVTLVPGESHEIVVQYEADQDEAPNWGTLQLVTNDDEHPQVDVWLADTETTIEFETTRAPGRTSVAMSIGAAQAGTTVALNLSRPSTRSAAAGIDALGIRVAEDSDFRMNVTSAASPLPGMPGFEVGDNTTAIGHFRVDHDIDESAVNSGWFRFRLAKSRFSSNNTRPEHVVLYRYADGKWHELETSVVGETDTHWIFRSETPGFSDFTAGVKQPKFEVTHATVDVDRVAPGDAVRVRVRITNTGEADGRFTANLVLNGEVVDSRTATIAVNGTRQLTFERVFDEPGEYEVRINGVLADEIVVEGDTETGSGSTAVPVGYDPFLLAGVVIGVLVLGGGLVLWRGTSADEDGTAPEPDPSDGPTDESGPEDDASVFRDRGGSGPD